MEFKHHFKHVDLSESLKNYVEGLLVKHAHLQLKDSVCNVYYSKSKHHHQCQVEIQLQNGTGHFKAHAIEDDFYLACDAAAEKVSKQLQKLKEKLQHHRAS